MPGSVDSCNRRMPPIDLTGRGRRGWRLRCLSSLAAAVGGHRARWRRRLPLKPWRFSNRSPVSMPRKDRYEDAQVRTVRAESACAAQCCRNRAAIVRGRAERYAAAPDRRGLAGGAGLGIGYRVDRGHLSRGCPKGSGLLAHIRCAPPGPTAGCTRGTGGGGGASRPSNLPRRKRWAARLRRLGCSARYTTEKLLHPEKP